MKEQRGIVFPMKDRALALELCPTEGWIIRPHADRSGFFAGWLWRISSDRDAVKSQTLHCSLNVQQKVLQSLVNMVSFDPVNIAATISGFDRNLSRALHNRTSNFLEFSLEVPE
jgi:hypothetical protein